jgi:hypothetical protein
MTMPKLQTRYLALAFLGLVALPACLAGCGNGGQATPAGYWEGSVTARETPLKDHARTLTRNVDAEFWFTVDWDKTRNIGYVSGEADAKYDAELKVENLPKVTAPVPGGSVKFEPNIGGKLTDTDNRRTFPIVGVLSIDQETGKGTLILQKATVVDSRTQRQRLDDEAKGVKGPDAPMEFTIRADPGVSGGISGAAGSVSANSDGTVTASAGGDASIEQSANLGGGGGGVIVQKIPMKPFSPFSDAAGKVEKRRGGPFAASFEEKSDKHTIKWTAKQMGGEQREPVELTPEMRRQIEQLVEQLNRRR